MGLRIMATLTGALVLAACGGGSDGGGGDDGGGPPTAGADTPATFATPDDAAGQVAAFIALGESSFDQAPSGEMRKAVTTEDCGAGGTVSYDDETGRYVYDNCREAAQGFSSRIDGVLIDACTGGGAADESPDNCGAASQSGMGDYTLTFGESGQPLVTETNTGQGDFSLSARGTVREQTTSSTEEFTATVEFAIDTTDAPAFSLIMDDLRVFENAAPSDGSRLQMSIDGGFGTDAGRNSRCGLGFATYETVTPISFDNNDEPFAGELNLTSENGDSANITFNNDGSVTVTVNGTAQMYTQDDLMNLCAASSGG